MKTRPFLSALIAMADHSAIKVFVYDKPAYGGGVCGFVLMGVIYS